jgi:hypothetical protein
MVHSGQEDTWEHIAAARLVRFVGAKWEIVRISSISNHRIRVHNGHTEANTGGQWAATQMMIISHAVVASLNSVRFDLSAHHTQTVGEKFSQH